MKFSIFLLSFILTLPCQVIAAEKMDLQPKIQPGYQPVDAETEKGLWMELGEYEAAIRRSALLIKDGIERPPIDVRYEGFHIPPEFVIGYGLDFDGKYRNLPHVAVMEEDDV